MCYSVTVEQWLITSALSDEFKSESHNQIHLAIRLFISWQSSNYYASPIQNKGIFHQTVIIKKKGKRYEGINYVSTYNTFSVITCK